MFLACDFLERYSIFCAPDLPAGAGSESGLRFKFGVRGFRVCGMGL